MCTLVRNSETTQRPRKAPQQKDGPGAPHIDGTEPTCRRREPRQKDQAGEALRAEGQFPRRSSLLSVSSGYSEPVHICRALRAQTRQKKQGAKRAGFSELFFIYVYLPLFSDIFYYIEICAPYAPNVQKTAQLSRFSGGIFWGIFCFFLPLFQFLPLTFDGVFSPGAFSGAFSDIFLPLNYGAFWGKRGKKGTFPAVVFSVWTSERFRSEGQKGQKGQVFRSRLYAWRDILPAFSGSPWAV